MYQGLGQISQCHLLWVKEHTLLRKQETQMRCRRCCWGPNLWTLCVHTWVHPQLWGTVATGWELPTLSTCYHPSTLPEGSFLHPLSLLGSKEGQPGSTRGFSPQGQPHQFGDGSEWTNSDSSFFSRTLLRCILHCSLGGPRGTELHLATALSSPSIYSLQTFLSSQYLASLVHLCLFVLPNKLPAPTSGALL